MRRLYALLLTLATPLVLAYLGVRGLRDSRYWKRWGERLGWTAAPAGPVDTLVHAASLGEVNAALPLVKALQAKHPENRILVTTFTPTGSQRVRELFGNEVDHCYLPLDLPWAIRRLLNRARPGRVIIVETEIWPNLYAHIQHRGIPMLMANARLSRQSVNGYQRFSSLIAPALAGVDRILAQGQKDARRFMECGAKPDRVERAGNLKFDIELSPTLWETGELLRAGWGVDRPVLVAGSTHEDDERVILPAFRQVLERHPRALLVLAPRHPERFARAAQQVASAGLSLRRRSDGRFPGDAQCLVLDTLGELLSYYAAGDVTFVGGTIADVGGHNLLEPAALGKPLLFGPHTANVKETATRLLASGAAHRVLTVEDMRTELNQLFDHPATRDRMGQAGLKLVTQGRGALHKTMEALDQVGRAPST